MRQYSQYFAALPNQTDVGCSGVICIFSLTHKHTHRPLILSQLFWHAVLDVLLRDNHMCSVHLALVEQANSRHIRHTDTQHNMLRSCKGTEPIESNEHKK